MNIMVVFLLITSLIVPLVYIIQIFAKWKQTADKINKIPGPASYPLIGTSWDFISCPQKDIFKVLLRRANTYRPIFRTWSGQTPEVHFMKAEHIELVMNNIKQIEKGLIYTFMQPWLGFGLLTSHGERWRKHRKLITPTFHFKILENFFETFSEKSNKLVEQLNTKANGKTFNIFPLITHCTLDMICETAMGVEVNAMDKSDSDYVSAIYRISQMSLQRTVSPWLHKDFIFYNLSSVGKEYKKCLTILHNFTNKVIRDRKKLCKVETSNNKLSDDDMLLGKKKRMAFLDLLIEASNDGKNLSDTDIREEVDTFMFEGHDTTTAGICWSLFLLGNHPDVQDKVVEELQNIFGDDDRPITLEDLNQMKYLERVIKESLRLYPSVPYITRILGEDIEIDNYRIPRGCTAVLHIYDTHRDPTQFPDPERFNPDNFLPERCQKRHPYAYVPFSAGARNCIGQKFAIMEEKTILAAILRKFKIRSLETQSSIKIVAELILRPENGLLVTLVPRQ